MKELSRPARKRLAARAPELDRPCLKPGLRLGAWHLRSLSPGFPVSKMGTMTELWSPGGCETGWLAVQSRHREERRVRNQAGGPLWGDGMHLLSASSVAAVGTGLRLALAARPVGLSVDEGGSGNRRSGSEIPGGRRSPWVPGTSGDLKQRAPVTGQADRKRKSWARGLSVCSCVREPGLPPAGGRS